MAPVSRAISVPTPRRVSYQTVGPVGKRGSKLRRASEIPVNSIKASIGHTMGAAAALEAVMCLMAGREGIVPKTLGLEEPDPACELDHVIGAPRAARPRISLSTSLGFGGCNAALVLEAVDP